MRMSFRKIIFLTVFPLLISPVALAQISPGELAEAHSHLEGLSNCTKCHILGQKVSNEKCLECHTELKQRIGLQKGYHSSILVKTKECVNCHSDHHGRNFELVRFDISAFKHDFTGYELKGAHKEQDCSDCHKKEYIAEPKIRDKKFTYLGLGTDCLSCHADYHQGTLSERCAECHGNDSFKPALYFDHERTNFRLKGKHAGVECSGCHKVVTRDGKKFQVFADVPHANCTNCHVDVHKNRFGQNCRECHNEESFRAVKIVSDFDHSRTGFELEGRHMFVDCSACHKSNYTDPIKHERCSDCHEDYHRGQFTKPGVTPDCSSCHDAQGFTMTSFSIGRHNEGVFPLEGAHLATPCIACHLKGERWSFREIGIRCADCHPDIHKDFLDTKYYPRSECTVCHSVNSWHNIRFDHGVTGWELKGAHLQQACRACHFPEVSPGKVIQRFTGMGKECIACHTDVHSGQFNREGKTDCTRCHGAESWIPTVFDHNTARFVLDGKHKDVACVKCHYLVSEGNLTYRKYKFEDISCESCHR